MAPKCILVHKLSEESQGNVSDRDVTNEIVNTRLFKSSQFLGYWVWNTIPLLSAGGDVHVVRHGTFLYWGWVQMFKTQAWLVTSVITNIWVWFSSHY